MKLTKLILLGIGATALVLLPRRSSPKDNQKTPNFKDTNTTPQDNPKNPNSPNNNPN